MGVSSRLPQKFACTPGWYYRFQGIKNFKFGVGCSGVIFKSSLIKIHLGVADKKQAGWHTDIASTVYDLFWGTAMKAQNVSWREKSVNMRTEFTVSEWGPVTGIYDHGVQPTTLIKARH
jgi:hypothetical protein